MQIWSSITIISLKNSILEGGFASKIINSSNCIGWNRFCRCWRCSDLSYQLILMGKLISSKNRQILMIQVSFERKSSVDSKFTWIIKLWRSIEEKSLMQDWEFSTIDFSSTDGRKSTEIARIDSARKVVSIQVDSGLVQAVRNLSASCPLHLSSRTKICGSVFSAMASSISMSLVLFDRIFQGL